MEETALLHAVHRIVGGVEVQYQTAGRTRKRCDELLQQRLVQANRLGPAHPILQSAQGGSAGQRFIGIHRRLQRRVRPQFVVVVQVFVSQRQGIHPLPHHRPERMSATRLAAGVGQRLRGAFGQSQHPVGLAQQHCAAVGGDGSAGKTGLHKATFAAWKTNGFQITIRHGQGVLRYQLK